MRRRLLLPQLRDTQCGFKLFTHEAAVHVFSVVQEEGFLFDCEALGAAEALGYRIVEVGVRWRHDADSRVNVLRECLVATPKLWRIVRRVRRLRRERR
jgi:dolichyl-phosphate beta-glucosyltransferase